VSRAHYAALRVAAVRQFNDKFAIGRRDAVVHPQEPLARQQLAEHGHANKHTVADLLEDP